MATAASSSVDALRSATGQDTPSATRAKSQWPDGHEDRVVALVHDIYTRNIDKSIGRRREGLANVEFFLGHHWARWDNRLNRYDNSEPKTTRGKKDFPKQTINVFGVIMRTAISRFLGTHPFVSISAGSQDQMVVDAARIAQRVFSDYGWYEMDVQAFLQKLIPTLLLKRDAYICQEWDALGGEPIGEVPVLELDMSGQPIMDEVMEPVVDPETGEPVIGPDGQPLVQPGVQPRQAMNDDGTPQFRIRYKGKPKLTCLDPDHVIDDDSITDPANARWYLIEDWVSTADIFDEFGVLVTPDRAGYRDRPQSRWREGDSEASVQKLTLWVKRGTYAYGDGQVVSFPSSRRVVVAGRKLLADDKMLYEHGQIPIYHVRCTVAPDCLRGASFADDVRQIQHAFNLLCTSVNLSTALAGIPVWLVNQTHNVKQNTLTSTPGGVVEYTHVQGNVPPPVRLDGRSVASSAMSYLNFLFMLMQDVAGQHQGGLMGGDPGANSSGVKLESLNERDLAKLGATAMQIGMAFEWIARIYLALWKQFRPERETIAVAGALMGSEAMDFGGVDIHDSFVIRAVSESFLPQSRAARFQKNMVLLQGQLISNREFMRREGDAADEEATLEAMHASKARDENREARSTDAIQATLNPQSMLLDDHMVHWEDHLRAILDPSMPPEAKMALQEHLFMHDEIMNAALQRARQQEAPADSPQEGQPGEGSGSEPAPEEQAAEEVMQ